MDQKEYEFKSKDIHKTREFFISLRKLIDKIDDDLLEKTRCFLILRRVRYAVIIFVFERSIGMGSNVAECLNPPNE
jgi:hypothetical protein